MKFEPNSKKRNLANINIKDEVAFNIIKKARINATKKDVSFTTLALKILDEYNKGNLKIEF
jgi:hypothetical protein